MTECVPRTFLSRVVVLGQCGGSTISLHSATRSSLLWLVWIIVIIVAFHLKINMLMTGYVGINVMSRQPRLKHGDL